MRVSHAAVSRHVQVVGGAARRDAVPACQARRRADRGRRALSEGRLEPPSRRRSRRRRRRWRNQGRAGPRQRRAGLRQPLADPTALAASRPPIPMSTSCWTRRRGWSTSRATRPTMAVRYGQGGWPGLRQDLVASSRIFAVGRKELRGRRRAAFAPGRSCAPSSCCTRTTAGCGGAGSRPRASPTSMSAVGRASSETGLALDAARRPDRASPWPTGVDRGRPRPRPAHEALRCRPGRRRLPICSASPARSGGARSPPSAIGCWRRRHRYVVRSHWRRWRLCRPAPLAVIVAAASGVAAEGDIEVERWAPAASPALRLPSVPSTAAQASARVRPMSRSMRSSSNSSWCKASLPIPPCRQSSERRSRPSGDRAHGPADDCHRQKSDPCHGLGAPPGPARCRTEASDRSLCQSLICHLPSRVSMK